LKGLMPLKRSGNPNTRADRRLTFVPSTASLSLLLPKPEYKGR